MTKRLSFVALAALLCLTIFTTSCQKVRRNTARARVNTLLVTGNYLKPRLLCELAQYRSKQPILLVQNDQASLEGTPRLFYLPGSGSREGEEISATQFNEFLTFLNPKVVVFVGNLDEDYPADFVNQARENFRVLTVSSNDWDKNAQLLGEVMRLPRLARDYREQLDRFEAAKIIPAAK
ncbi:MAG: hypothetical protein J6Y80_02690 [Victivallales bacterium]|nr:hypothetical protein [Victivallales bacterium]